MGRLAWLLAASMLLVMAAPVAAQYVNPDTCSMADFSCQQVRKERDDRNTSYDDQPQRNRIAQAQKLQALIKAPPLPAQRNLLLGTWRLDQGKQSSPTSIGLLNEILAPHIQGMCSRYFGSGITFTSTAYSISGHSQATGWSVAYRSAGRQAVAAIVPGDQYASMLFKFSSPNHIVSELDGCALVRVGAPEGSAQAKAPTAAGGTASRAIGAGGMANSGVNFGVSIETVRQSLSGRRVDLMPAMHHGNLHRLVASGEFPEIDPRIIRLTYEFDAPEGPSAKLIGVMVTYARDGSAESAVFSERASALSKRYPLATQSQGKMEASVSGMVVSLIDDPNFGQLHELYRKR